MLSSFGQRRHLFSAAVERALPPSMLREIRSLIVSYHSDIGLVAVSAWPVVWDWTPTPQPSAGSTTLAVQRIGAAPALSGVHLCIPFGADRLLFATIKTHVLVWHLRARGPSSMS